MGALVAPAATVVDEPSTFTRTANVVSFTMITDALAGPLACGCGVVEADAEGLALGVALAFADGLLVALGFGLALAVADDLVLGVVVGALVVADTVAGVGDGVGTTLVAMVGGVVGCGDCGTFELGVARVDETGAWDAVALAAGVAFVLAFECATRDIATDPMMSAATPAAAATTVTIPRRGMSDPPDCGNSRAFLSGV
jgi:hypothetical protein